MTYVMRRKVVMKVNKYTMLVEYFGGYDVNHIEYLLERFIMNDDNSTYLADFFDEWRIQCGLSTDQSLCCQKTVFPYRVLLSILKYKENY